MPPYLDVIDQAVAERCAQFVEQFSDMHDINCLTNGQLCCVMARSIREMQVDGYFEGLHKAVWSETATTQ